MPFKNPADKRRWRQRYRHRLIATSRPMPATCEVCGADPSTAGKNGRKVLDLDHCHSTNRFRGWLCGCCNRALGQSGDDPVRLRKLAQYLEDFALLL